MRDRLKIVIPGNPGDGSVNGWKTPIIRRTRKGPRASMVEGKNYRRWKAKAAAAFRDAADGIRFTDGPLAVDVTAYWPRMNRTGAAKGLPFGDVDAVVKAALDAMEECSARGNDSLIGNDSQVIEVTARKRYDKEDPRIEIEIWPYDGDAT